MAENVQFSLSPEDVRVFNDRRNRANRDFGDQNAGLELAKTRAGTDFGRDFRTGQNLGGGLFGQLRDRFKDSRDRLTDTNRQRGTFNSGILTNTVNKHFRTKNTAFEDLEIKFGRASGDFNTAGANIGNRLDDALSTIENDQQLRRSVFASMIQNDKI